MASIDMVTEPLPPAFQWTPTHNAWRGTTEFYIQTAEHLAKRHAVQVFYDGGALVHNGVRYVPRHRHPDQSTGDVLLACNADVRTRGYRRRVRWSNFYHDRLATAPPGYDKHIVISSFHRGLFGGGIIVPHGYDPSLYRYSTEPRDKKILFTSSPDRGQDFLQSIAGSVYKATGYRFEFGYRGASEAEMADRYRHASVWVHPGIGNELFCIAALKAQVSGCVPVIVPTGALGETVKRGVTAPTLDAFVAVLTNLLQDSVRMEQIRCDLGQVRHRTWAEVTADLETVLEGR